MAFMAMNGWGMRDPGHAVEQRGPRYTVIRIVTNPEHDRKHHERSPAMGTARSWLAVDEPVPAVRRLRLNRPEKRNALSADLVEALIAALEQAEADGVAVIAIEGHGPNLSAGFDFSDLDQMTDADLLVRFVRLEMLFQRLLSASAVTVGFAHGKNFGAGVDLLGACRHRIATEDASFRMPGLQFGVVLGTRRFAQTVGEHTAYRILEASESMNAAYAHRIGFVTQVAAPEDWPGVLDCMAARSRVLCHDARTALLGATLLTSADADLADLVRSVAAPGLKDRIRRYLDAQSR